MESNKWREEAMNNWDERERERKRKRGPANSMMLFKTERSLWGWEFMMTRVEERSSSLSMNVKQQVLRVLYYCCVKNVSPPQLLRLLHMFRCNCNFFPWNRNLNYNNITPTQTFSLPAPLPQWPRPQGIFIHSLSSHLSFLFTQISNLIPCLLYAPNPTR